MCGLWLGTRGGELWDEVNGVGTEGYLRSVHLCTASLAATTPTRWMALIWATRSGGHTAPAEFGVLLPPWSQNSCPLIFSLSVAVFDSQVSFGTRQTAKCRRNASDAWIGGMESVPVSAEDQAIGSAWSTVV